MWHWFAPSILWFLWGNHHFCPCMSDTRVHGELTEILKISTKTNAWKQLRGMLKCEQATFTNITTCQWRSSTNRMWRMPFSSIICDISWIYFGAAFVSILFLSLLIWTLPTFSSHFYPFAPFFLPFKAPSRNLLLILITDPDVSAKSLLNSAFCDETFLSLEQVVRDLSCEYFYV